MLSSDFKINCYKKFSAKNIRSWAHFDSFTLKRVTDSDKREKLVIKSISIHKFKYLKIFYFVSWL